MNVDIDKDIDAAIVIRSIFTLILNFSDLIEDNIFLIVSFLITPFNKGRDDLQYIYIHIIPMKELINII
jgi:hypothetical protein